MGSRAFKCQSEIKILSPNLTFSDITMVMREDCLVTARYGWKYRLPPQLLSVGRGCSHVVFPVVVLGAGQSKSSFALEDCPFLDYLAAEIILLLRHFSYVFVIPSLPASLVPHLGHKRPEKTQGTHFSVYPKVLNSINSLPSLQLSTSSCICVTYYVLCCELYISGGTGRRASIPTFLRIAKLLFLPHCCILKGCKFSRSIITFESHSAQGRRED